LASACRWDHVSLPEVDEAPEAPPPYEGVGAGVDEAAEACAAAKGLTSFFGFGSETGV
jgi:hypothetical protein